MRVEPPGFTRPKPLLLLAYLALEGPQSRRRIADVFWPTGNRMKSLSMALTRLREGVPGSVSERDGRIVTDLGCDVLELLGALDDGDFEPVQALYRGAFLDGVGFGAEGAELEDWVFATREYLASRVQLSFVQQAERAAATGDLRLGAAMAERAYRLPGVTASEPATLRRLHLLLRVTDSVRAQDVLRELRSYEPVRIDGESDVANATHPAHGGSKHNLSLGNTSFVGRARELRLIEGFLSDPTCRLVTVTGMGGIGKSRLAMRAGLDQLEHDRYLDGVYFVPLSTNGRGDDVPLRIAAALGLEPASDALGWQAVSGFLRTKRALLILDDVVVSPGLVSRLSRLLGEAPDLDVIVTSRERLAIAEEQVFSLDGLGLPDEEGLDAGGQRADSVQLFIERALRRRHDLELGAGMPHVRDICLRLEGHPLALELAADWVRFLTLEEIAMELGEGLGLLGSGKGDARERRDGIRAVFDSSWTLLGDRERAALRRLSVFRGPFRRDAAGRVARCGLATLARLVDRSLVRAMPDGRFDVHPLLRAYLEERAHEEPEEVEQSRRELGRWLVDLMEEQGGLLRSEGQAEVVRTLDEVWPDFRSAYGWLLDNGDQDAVERFIDLMEVSFQVRGAYSEGLEVLREIEARYASVGECEQVRWRAVLEQAWYHHQLGQFEAAWDAASRVLTGTSRREHACLVASAHQAMALIEQARGLYARSRRRLRLALGLAVSCPGSRTEARILSALAAAEVVMGDAGASAERYEKAIRLNRLGGRIVNVARDLGNLGAVCGRLGDRDRAIQLLEESVSLARDQGFLQLLPYGLSNLGAEYERSGRTEAALELTTEALAAAERTGQREIQVGILANLVSMLATVGKTDEAANLSDEALHMALDLDASQKLTQALFTRAELEVGRERFEQAAVLYALVESDPASTSEVVELAGDGLVGLERRLGAERSRAVGRVVDGLSLRRGARYVLDGSLAALLGEPGRTAAGASASTRAN